MLKILLMKIVLPFYMKFDTLMAHLQKFHFVKLRSFNINFQCRITK